MWHLLRGKNRRGVEDLEILWAIFVRCRFPFAPFSDRTSPELRMANEELLQTIGLAMPEFIGPPSAATPRIYLVPTSGPAVAVASVCMRDNSGDHRCETT